jgi:ribosomal subunit interface protein
METRVTARHCEIPDAVRQRAHLVMERIAKIAYRPQRGEVIFDVDHQRKRVELKLHLTRGNTGVATAEAQDFRTALDRAAAKLRRQVQRTDPRRPRRRVEG